MAKTLGSSMGNVGRMLGEALRARGVSMSGAITERERRKREQKDQFMRQVFDAAGKGLLTPEQASLFGGQIGEGEFRQEQFGGSLAGGRLRLEDIKRKEAEAGRTHAAGLATERETGATERARLGRELQRDLAEGREGKKETLEEKKARKKQEALGQAVGSARFDASFKYQRGKLAGAVIEQEDLLKVLKDKETFEEKWSKLFPSQEFAQVFPDGVKSEEVARFRTYVGKQLAQRKTDLDEHDEWLVSTRPRFGQTPESYQQILIEKDVSLELQEALFRKYASTLGVTQDEITEHFTAIQPGTPESEVGGLESPSKTEVEQYARELLAGGTPVEAIARMIKLKYPNFVVPTVPTGPVKL